VQATILKNELCPGTALPLPSQGASGSTGDLRHFIALLADAGLLVRVREEIDWRFDLGRMTRESPTALLFENIKGYPGQRVFTNGLRDTRSIALALGLKHGTIRKTLIPEAQKRIATPVKPSLLKTGPVLQNLVPAIDVNLLTLPVPQWNNHDRGRYIGTWHINVTKDPETGVRNVGVYRMQMLGPKQATVSASPRSHLSRQVARAEKNGQPLPMAVAIGVSEAIVMAAAAAYPEGMDEYDLAGGLLQEAVQLISCQTVNLEVPAQSEIVIEGLIKPGVRVQDGPYFDYTGKPNTNPNAFLFEATQLMFRSDPIFRGTSIGVPAAEDHQLFAFLTELNLVDFHGSRVKQGVQDLLLKQRMFRAFQLVGKMGEYVSRWHSLHSFSI
jgi:4-hydroxy-3-polyprenylbenzoate decarboxylase